MKKIILCGIGKRCKEIYPFIEYLLSKKNIGKIYGAIDINQEIKEFNKIPVCGPEKICEDNEEDKVYFITVFDKNIIDFYRKKLKNKTYVIYKNKESIAELLGLSIREIRREFCAYTHINNMDDYFTVAEEQPAIDVFWSKKSIFRQLFDKLDANNIIELACGRGRHVNQYIEQAEHVTLVDILPENIEVCKKRFNNYKKISYYKNSGFNLSDLSSENYSSVFCYDAMVHFELLDISDYLKDIFRVLNKGGRALLHHSNYDAFYDIKFEHSIHGRAFMNYKIFAYLALQAGFNILEQRIVDWGDDALQLDCVTLIEKPL